MSSQWILQVCVPRGIYRCASLEGFTAVHLRGDLQLCVSGGIYNCAFLEESTATRSWRNLQMCVYGEIYSCASKNLHMFIMEGSTDVCQRLYSFL